LYETDPRCESGILNIYKRPITLQITDGCLQSTAGQWTLSHTAGCCDCASSQGSAEPSSAGSETSACDYTGQITVGIGDLHRSGDNLCENRVALDVANGLICGVTPLDEQCADVCDCGSSSGQPSSETSSPPSSESAQSSGSSPSYPCDLEITCFEDGTWKWSWGEPFPGQASFIKRVWNVTKNELHKQGICQGVQPDTTFQISTGDWEINDCDTYRIEVDFYDGDMAQCNGNVIAHCEAEFSCRSSCSSSSSSLPSSSSHDCNLSVQCGSGPDYQMSWAWDPIPGQASYTAVVYDDQDQVHCNIACGGVQPDTSGLTVSPGVCDISDCGTYRVVVTFYDGDVGQCNGDVIAVCEAEFACCSSSLSSSSTSQFTCGSSCSSSLTSLSPSSMSETSGASQESSAASEECPLNCNWIWNESTQEWELGGQGIQCEAAGCTCEAAPVEDGGYDGQEEWVVCDP